MPKIVSTTKEPASNPAIAGPKNAITGVRPPFKAWTRTTRVSVKPFARAVLIKS